jgi:hypothetical protein
MVRRSARSAHRCRRARLTRISALHRLSNRVGYRLFGFGGLGNAPTLQSIAASANGSLPVSAANWGQDMLGAPVTTTAQWLSAVSLLRSPAGHNRSLAGTYAYPPAWGTIESTFNLVGDNSPLDYNSAMSGSIQNTVSVMSSTFGILPVAVFQVGCSSFTFSTLDATSATYWAEHWEVYKHTYVTAVWAWRRGITKIEQHNEADLSANNACMTPQYWSDYYTLRSRAMQDAYADMNADVAAGRASCPVAACPININLLASAFAAVSLTPGQITGVSITNEHLQFPNSLGMASNYSNLQSYSYHSYGKSGSQLMQTATSVQAELAVMRPGEQPIPVVITEHASNTSGSWQMDGTNSDMYFHASRLGAQLLSVASAGIETYGARGCCARGSGGVGGRARGAPTLCRQMAARAAAAATRLGRRGSGGCARVGGSLRVLRPIRCFLQRARCVTHLHAARPRAVFKASMQPSGSLPGAATKVIKSGILFADNNMAPYAIGDTTTSGKVMSLFVPHLVGAKPLFTCSGFTSAFQICLLLRGTGKWHIFLVNDFDFMRGGQTAAGMPAAVGQNSDRMLSMSLAPLSVPPSSWAVIDEVSTNSLYGEVAAIVPVSSLGSASTLQYLLPAYGAARISIPSSPQNMAVMPSTADATIFAGANFNANFGTITTLTVNTSPSSVHDTTAVALVQFGFSMYTVASIAVLELSVKQAPNATVILSVIGINPVKPAVWTESGISWNSASWVVTQPSGFISSVSKNFALMVRAALKCRLLTRMPLQKSVRADRYALRRRRARRVPARATATCWLVTSPCRPATRARRSAST